MNQHDFETRLLHLWMTTRVPLSRANLLFFTHAPRRKLERWLDEMVREGVLDIDSDDEGETVWTVRGASRPSRGAERVEDVVKIEQLSTEVRGRSGGRARGGLSFGSPRNFASQALARSGGDKSVIASAALSLLGPIGWVYAGPLREAIPAAILYWVLMRIVYVLPWFISGPMASLMVMGSVLAGVVYAWQYNKNGQVTPLLTDDDRPRLPGKR